MKYILTVLVLLICYQISYSEGKKQFKHILITNDDGIEDAKRLLALAESVKNVADRVSIIVSAFDRSGTSNQTTLGKYQSILELTCKYQDKKKNIAAYTIPGNPADNVLLGLNGLFPDDKPDLVLSGINGGTNSGPDWFGSGTIGAVRMSAFLGVKGIALSGFDDDDPRSFKLIPDWITKFISSGILDEIDKNTYLTISFPKIPLEKIKGIIIAERKISFDRPELAVFSKILGDNPHLPGERSIWTLKNEQGINYTSNNDGTYLLEGFIVVTPMTINENNTQLLNKLEKKTNQIPTFSIE